MSDKSNKKLTPTRTQEGPALFADFASVSAGSFGVKITFGDITEDTDDEMKVNEFMTIGMSAEHARILANILVQNLRKYETRYGSIRVPERFKDLPDEAQPDDEDSK